MQTRIVPLFFACLVLGLGASMAAAVEGQQGPAPEGKQAAYFDSDRQQWLYDTDGDGTVDLSEELGGTDPFDPTDFPEARFQLPEDTDKVGFVTSSCRSNMRLISSRLCIDTDEQNATHYETAQVACRYRRARVCTYEDLYFVYTTSSWDGTYNPYGMWLGDFVHDDTVLCGNKVVDYNNDPDIYNFEGHCNKDLAKQYYCCHDRE